MRPDAGRGIAVTPENAAFMFLVALFLFLPFEEGGMTSFSIFVQQALILSAAALIAASLPGRPAFKLEIRWIGLLLFLLFCHLAFSLVYAVYQYAAILDIIRYFFLGLLYLSLIRLFEQDGARRRMLGAAVCLSCACSAGYALYQAFYASVERPPAWFLNTNNLAAFLNIGLFLALFTGLPRRLSSRPVRALLVILLGCALYATRSRSGWIAFFVILAVALFHRRKVLVLIPLGLLVLILAVPNPLKTYVRELPSRDIYAFQRYDIWKMALRMIKDRPFVGVAAAQFDLYAPHYNFPVEKGDARYGKVPQTAHNLILHYAVELGLPAALILIAIILALWALFLSPRPPPAGRGYLAALCAVLIMDLFYENMLNNAVAAAVVFCFAAAGQGEDRWLFRKVAEKRFSPRVPQDERSPRPALARYHLCLWLTVLLVFILAVFIPYAGDRRYRQALVKDGRQDFVGAFEEIRAAADMIPIHAGYHRFLAGLYASYFLSSGDPEAFFYAEGAYERALSRNARDADGWMARAALYANLFSRGFPSAYCFETAEGHYLQASRLASSNPFVYYNLAGHYLNAGKSRSAESCLQRAVELEPNFIAAYCRLHALYLEEGNQAAADRTAGRTGDLIRRYSGASFPAGSYLEALLRVPEACLQAPVTKPEPAPGP
jgi:O-antigen ligase